MFWKRFLSSVVLWGGVLGLLLSGSNLASWFVATGFALLGQYEFYRAQEEKGLAVLKWTGLYFGALWYLGFLLSLVLKPEWSLGLPMYQGILIVGLILAGLIRPVLGSTEKATPVVTVSLTVMGFFYVPYLFGFTALLAFTPPHGCDPRWLIVYLLAVTKFTDLGAYVTGMLIGKHKMIPRVSPGKTWEGFIGGLIISMGVSLGIVAAAGSSLEKLAGWHAVVIGILLALASVVGDLAESVVKRDAHIKDSGHSIPGIGGALDLIDSLLFTAPLLYFYLQFFV